MSATSSADWERMLDWRGIVAALALVGLGWLAGDWSMRQADLRTRDGLLQQVLQVAGAIDLNAARSLSFTEADEGTPAFEEIRRQMIASAQSSRHRSIYSMAIRNDAIVFGPESLDRGDAMASAPGEVYEQPSPGDWEALRSGKPFVAGPLADEYGTFITAVAPVFDARSGDVLMAVGIDIPADEWRAQIRAARIPPILGATLMALVLLGGMVVIGRRKGMPTQREGRLGHLESALVAALGLFVTGALFLQAERLEKDQLADRFRTQAAAQAGLLRSEICEYLASVDSVRRFVEGSENVNREEFLSFVQPIFGGKVYRALQWAPRVPRAKRAEFEAAMRREGLERFEITERDGQGRAIPAGDRAEYFPVLHAEPREENTSGIGLDLGSDPSHLQALAKARDTGRPVAITFSSPSASGGGPTAELLLIAPVYSRGKPDATADQRRAKLAGFVAGIIGIGDGAKRILRGAAPFDICHSLLDLSANRVERVLFCEGTGQRETEPKDPRFHSTLDFPFADRVFRVVSAPKHEFFSDPTRRTQLWIILPLGVILALLSAGYTNRMVSSKRRAEEEKFEMERRLLHAQKLESLGVLVGGIAHDFNNLLTAIQGNLDLAAADLSPGSPAGPSIEQAMMAAERATHLTGQMLAYAGKGEIHIRPINIGELVTENVSMLRAAIPKTVALDLHIDESVPPILADPGQLQQVVMNLITNAAEAIGEHPGTVAIATGVRDCDAAYLERSHVEIKPAPGRFAMITVTDSGCGMDQETLRKLFDPFFTTKIRGRGLGMAAVLGIVQAHQGAISIRTRINRGTTVEVLLPVSADADTAPSGNDAAKTAPPAPLAKPAPSGAILIVDDEIPVRDLCARMMERCGFRVMRAADGKEAVAIFREHHREIACVILDMVMPHMDGVATFGALRRIKPTVPVIRCSGFNEDETASHFEGQEFTSFLQKPFQFAALRAELDRMLAGLNRMPR